MTKPTKSDSPSKLCGKPDCEKPLRARGLCASHYNQQHHPNRHAKKMVACAWCGKEALKGSGGGRKYGAVCSLECRQWLATPWCVLPEDHWARWYGKASKWKPKPVTMTVEERGRSQRSALRAAIEDGHSEDLLNALFDLSELTERGCWQWRKATREGYPIYQMALKGGKTKVYRLHRVALEAALGKSLGKQAAHHACANSLCVNPDHLQPISFRENTAEMMQRNYYIRRIRELEAALGELAPEHPLLGVISLPQSA